MGRMKRSRGRVEDMAVDGQLVGDYFNDKQFKRGFQAWLNQRWQEKDEVLEGWQQAQAPVSLTAKESADASSGS